MFKKIFLVCLFILFILSSISYAAAVRVSWEPPGTNQWETYVYVSEVSGNHDVTKPVAHATLDGNNVPTEVIVDNLLPGKTYYIVAKHYDPASKVTCQEFSNEVSYTVPSEPSVTVTPLPKPYVQEFKMSITITPVE